MTVASAEPSCALTEGGARSRTVGLARLRCTNPIDPEAFQPLELEAGSVAGDRKEFAGGQVRRLAGHSSTEALCLRPNRRCRATRRSP